MGTTQDEPRRRARNLDTAAGDPTYELIPLERIEPDSGPHRRTVARSKKPDLASSLEGHGQLVPVTVRRARGKYRIINGERRLRAAHHTIGVRALWCQVIADPGEAGALIRRIVEDLVRDEFPPVELGEMVARVRELRGGSIRGLAEELGIDRYRFYRAVRLLRLPPDAQEMVRRGDLPWSHAFEITRAPAEERQSIAEEVVREGLTHGQTVALVNRHRTAVGDGPRVKRKRWTFRVPGDCEVVVMTPPEATRTVVRRALRAAMSRLDER